MRKNNSIKSDKNNGANKGNNVRDFERIKKEVFASEGFASLDCEDTIEVNLFAEIERMNVRGEACEDDFEILRDCLESPEDESPYESRGRSALSRKLWGIDEPKEKDIQESFMYWIL